MTESTELNTTQPDNITDFTAHQGAANDLCQPAANTDVNHLEHQSVSQYKFADIDERTQKALLQTLLDLDAQKDSAFKAIFAEADSTAFAALGMLYMSTNLPEFLNQLGSHPLTNALTLATLTSAGAGSVLWKQTQTKAAKLDAFKTYAHNALQKDTGTSTQVFQNGLKTKNLGLHDTLSSEVQAMSDTTLQRRLATALDTTQPQKTPKAKATRFAKAAGQHLKGIAGDIVKIPLRAVQTVDTGLSVSKNALRNAFNLKSLQNATDQAQKTSLAVSAGLITVISGFLVTGADPVINDLKNNGLNAGNLLLGLSMLRSLPTLFVSAGNFKDATHTLVPQEEKPSTIQNTVNATVTSFFNTSFTPTTHAPQPKQTHALTPDIA